MIMGMPHPLNRYKQQETYNQIMQSWSKYLIVQAPTGSGKSAWPAQSGHDGYNSIALTRTKSLQDQYAGSYDFKTVKGKGAYPCGGENGTCDVCHAIGLEGDEMEACKFHCDYYTARIAALGSKHASLNYSKFFTELGQGGFVDRYKPDVIWLDEAHELSDLVTDHAGLQFQWSKVQDYLKPALIEFPDMQNDIPYELAMELFLEGQKKAIENAVTLLMNLAASLPKIELTKFSSKDQIREYRKVDAMKRKIANTLNLVDSDLSYWYAYSTDKEFVLKPLTARFNFTSLFDRANKIVMMSATIGNPELYAKELGIEEFEFINVPNAYKPHEWPIADMQCPRLSYRSTEQDKQRQADIIASYINQFDKNWRGVILTNSKAQSWELAGRLRKIVKRPFWIPQEGHSTDYVYNDWLRQRRGTVGLTWNFWEGVDLGDDNFVIIAKVPFTSFADGYDKARYFFDVEAARQRIVNKIVQGLGRVRRGKKEHYGPTANKFVGIADGNWTKLKNLFPSDVLKAIQ